jgi:hypothetical protein
MPRTARTRSRPTSPMPVLLNRSYDACAANWLGDCAALFARGACGSQEGQEVRRKPNP